MSCTPRIDARRLVDIERQYSVQIVRRETFDGTFYSSVIINGVVRFDRATRTQAIDAAWSFLRGEK